MAGRGKGLRSYFIHGHKLRKIIQYGFFVTVIVIGIQFYLWYKYHESGGKLFPIPRPAGVEGFLPISGLISLKYWIVSGVFSHVHPAAVVVLLAVIVSSLIFKKSFCSFICPVGLISEWLWKLGKSVFGMRALASWGWRVPKWIDYPLRSVKYLLLAFFLNAVLVAMDSAALREFIEMPYNKVSDVKMLLFFADISRFALGVIILLAVGSLFIANFWCRYICPYGALLGLISFLSPIKIRRNLATCTDCESCTKACPAMIKIHKEKVVRSDECIGCLECVAACPEKGTLYPALSGLRKRISPRIFAIGVFLVFFGFYITARLTGNWHNNISSEEYMFHIQRIDQPEYNHFR